MDLMYGICTATSLETPEAPRKEILSHTASTTPKESSTANYAAPVKPVSPSKSFMAPNSPRLLSLPSLPNRLLLIANAQFSSSSTSAPLITCSGYVPASSDQHATATIADLVAEVSLKDLTSHFDIHLSQVQDQCSSLQEQLAASIKTLERFEDRIERLEHRIGNLEQSSAEDVSSDEDSEILKYCQGKEYVALMSQLEAKKQELESVAEELKDGVAREQERHKKESIDINDRQADKV